MLHGTLTVTSVEPVSGEELASGELAMPGMRAALPFRSVRGESVTTRDAALAARIVARMRALDDAHGRPVRAQFALVDGAETLTSVEPTRVSPGALVRVLVERVRDGRLSRPEALARITPVEIATVGAFALPDGAPDLLARGLAASAGAAAGRLALPSDVTSATDGEPRVVVIDDAAPEDADAIRAAAAIVATSGGLTADAAIAARALRKPCVVSTPLRLGDRDGPARGDWVTVDGTRGAVHRGRLATRWTPATTFATELVAWLDVAPGESPEEALVRAQKATPQAG